MKEYISPKMEINEFNFNKEIASSGLGVWLESNDYQDAGITTITYECQS